MSKVVLIHSPIIFDNRKTPVGDQTSNPPVGLLYIASYLEKFGISVKLYDPVPQGLSLPDILEGINYERPSVVGISAVTFGARCAVQIAREIKSKCDPSIVIGLGGMHISTDPGFIDRYPYFDFGVVGEGEKIMLELVREILRGRRVSGIHYAELIKDLDELPFPARHLINPGDYYSPHQGKGEKPMATMIASRGCPYNCTFCSKPINRARYRARSGKNIADEMEQIYDEYGGRYSFVCDTMTLHRSKILDLCQELIHRRLKAKWIINTRVDLVDDELLAKMAEGGCTDLFLGIESGNERIRNEVIKKQLTDEQIFEAMKLCRKHGIQTNIYMMLGFPQETMKEIDDTINFCPKTGADFMGIHITWPQPGSKLYKQAIKEKIISEDVIDNFVNGKFGDEFHDFWPVYIPKGLSLKQLIDAKKRAYRKFYLRPSWILQRFRWYLRSPEKLFSDLREIRVGIRALIYGSTGSAET